MINIAIVEDNLSDLQDLKDKLSQVAREKGWQYHFKQYSSALQFLDSYQSESDIVFMDIELPDIDGLKASERLRKIDDSVSLVFVTRLGHLAIKGYEVDATDFIVKPVHYYRLRALMAKLVARIAKEKNDFITIRSATAVERIRRNDLVYVECERHKIVYHTEKKEIVASGTLSEVEKNLNARVFLRCHQSFLVNLKYISGFSTDRLALLTGEMIPISRAKRREIVGKINEFFAGSER